MQAAHTATSGATWSWESERNQSGEVSVGNRNGHSQMIDVATPNFVNIAADSDSSGRMHFKYAVLGSDSMVYMYQPFIAEWYSVRKEEFDESFSTKSEPLAIYTMENTQRENQFSFADYQYSLSATSGSASASCSFDGVSGRSNWVKRELTSELGSVEVALQCTSYSGRDFSNGVRTRSATLRVETNLALDIPELGYVEVSALYSDGPHYYEGTWLGGRGSWGPGQMFVITSYDIYYEENNSKFISPRRVSVATRGYGGRYFNKTVVQPPLLSWIDGTASIVTASNPSQYQSVIDQDVFFIRDGATTLLLKKHLIDSPPSIPFTGYLTEYYGDVYTENTDVYDF